MGHPREWGMGNGETFSVKEGREMDILTQPHELGPCSWFTSEEMEAQKG